MPQRLEILLIAVLVIFSCGLSQAVAGPSLGDPEVKILNSSQVYFPATIRRGDKFKKPAILVSDTVFNSISEWKEIKRRKLGPKDAEYHLLLKAANDKLYTALKRVRQAKGYDIIAETGAIECKDCTPTEITQAVIDQLPS